MTYVDGFVVPIKKDGLEMYKKMATTAKDVWMEFGALDYKECVIDDDNIQGMRSFAQTANVKDDEIVIFAYITYKSREDRDAINKKVMADPRLQDCPEQMKEWFDCSRMSYGGFKTIVEV